MQHFQRAWEINPRSSVAVHNLAVALALQGRLDEAVACGRKAVEIQPNSAALHCALAIALAMQDRLDEALASYRQDRWNLSPTIRWPTRA